MHTLGHTLYLINFFNPVDMLLVMLAVRTCVISRRELMSFSLCGLANIHIFSGQRQQGTVRHHAITRYCSGLAWWWSWTNHCYRLRLPWQLACFNVTKSKWFFLLSSWCVSRYRDNFSILRDVHISYDSFLPWLLIIS